MTFAKALMWLQLVLYLVGGTSYLLSKDYRLGLTAILYAGAIYTCFIL